MYLGFYKKYDYMTRKLLLTSQGLITEDIRNSLQSMINKPLEQCIVGYIPNAAVGKDDAYFDSKRAELQEYCSTIIDLDLSMVKGRYLEKGLEITDIIFVEGGNTFHLLDTMRSSGFDKLLPKFLDRGKVYVGKSSGSYVVCPTIEPATWKRVNNDMMGVTDLTGLNLVPFFVSVHFEEKYREAIKRAAEHTTYPIVAISDSQAILVEDSDYRLVGTGNKEFFNGFTERIKSRSRSF